MHLPADHLSALATHVLYGTLMGGADIVPGVSGGTVALVLGIYERLVTAVSRFDVTLLRLVKRRQWRAVAEHIDLRLLVPLGMGILLGFVIMTTLMHHLLSTQQTRSLTMALFFGLILASGILVAGMIEHRSWQHWVRSAVLGVAGAGFALWLTGLDTSMHAQPTYGYVFVSGAVAICAMILPGISGAMILLILGIYLHLTEIPGNLLRGVQLISGLTTIAVFALGCALGLLSFSKLLRWLLVRHHAVTMAILCGFMLGSLRKLWPFQIDQTPEIEKVKFKTFQPYVPDRLDGFVLAVVGVAILAVCLVFVAHRLACRRRASRSALQSRLDKAGR